MNSKQAQMVRQLAGVWRLVSSEFTTSSGKVIYPLGEDALGLAIFTESGYMSAQLMRQGRPAFASGDQASGTPEEIRAALQGYVAYYGQCEVDVEQQTLTTHVEGSMYPNWVGGEQVRFYELSDTQLILKTSPIAFGDEEFTGVLTWERK
jgi:Lipocalin-like domain